MLMAEENQQPLLKIRKKSNPFKLCRCHLIRTSCCTYSLQTDADLLVSANLETAERSIWSTNIIVSPNKREMSINWREQWEIWEQTLPVIKISSEMLHSLSKVRWNLPYALMQQCLFNQSHIRAFGSWGYIILLNINIFIVCTILLF